jgi:hypothetical protein
MSLQLIAKQMEAKGRNGDSVLVHMTPGEVAGLQQLAESAGGSLSVNPETGLVEANFLKQMLPTIVGLGVGMATMNPMLGAAAGAAVGGYQARRNDQDVGMGMLMGGLGGYGGASVAGGLGAAGAAGTGMGAGAAGTTPTMAQNFAQAGQGAQALGTAQGRAAAASYLGGTKGMMRTGLQALAPANMAPVEQPQSPYPQMSMDINRSVAPFQDIQAYQAPMPGYSGGSGNVYIPLSTVRAAEGGLMGLAKGGMKEGGFVVPADVVSMVGEGNTDAGYRRIMEFLPGASPIKGADGGQADTVETSIEGKQPAAVAHGEMYVPPEAVQKAGGAKKLYAMMDRVREQATGSKKQIKPVRLESAMA